MTDDASRLLSVIDQRIALHEAPRRQWSVTGEVTELAANGAWVLLAGEGRARFVRSIAALPVVLAVGDRVIVEMGDDGWLVVTSVLGRQPVPADGLPTIVVRARGSGLDDAPNIREAIAAAEPGTTILFPDTDYNLLSTFGDVAIDVRKHNIRLVGRRLGTSPGTGHTTFHHAPTDAAVETTYVVRFAYPEGESRIIGGGMENIHIAAGGALRGLALAAAAMMTFRGVQVWSPYDDLSGTALHIEDANASGTNSTQLTFEDCHFVVGGDSVALVLGALAVNVYAVRFSGCTFRCEDGIGVSIHAADDVWFYGCQFPVAGTGRTTYLDQAQAVQFIGCFQLYGGGALVKEPLYGGTLFLGMSTVDAIVQRPEIEPGAGGWYLDDYGRHTFRQDPASVITLTEDFFGQHGWTVLGGTVAAIPSEAAHGGIMRITTGTVDETLAGISLPNAGVLPAEGFWATFIFRFNSTLDTSVVYRVGLADAPGDDPPANGLYIEKAEADTKWWAVCRASGSETRAALPKRDIGTNSWVDADTASGSWMRVQILRRASSTPSIAFVQNDLINAQGEAMFSNIPNAVLYPFFMVKNKTTTSKTLDADLFQLHTIGLER